MALWYECGSGPIKLAKSFAKKDLGLDVYICCTGPSLADVKNEQLQVPGVFTIGINTSYPHIKPNMWIGMDKAGCYDPKLWWEPFLKICRGNYFEEKIEDFKIKNLPNVLFADVDKNSDPEAIFKLRNHNTKFVWQNNNLAVALHIAILMGAKRIFLLGCDLGGEKDYYDDRVLSNQQRQYNASLYKEQQKYLRWFHKTGKKYGIDLISCTKASPINDELRFYDLDYALMTSQERVPKLNINISHSTELEPVVKKKKQEGLKVFVGAEAVELVPTKVLESSIHARSSIPVEVKPLYEAMKDKGIKVPMPIKAENQPRTNFSFHRWCIPELCGYKGKALYCDSDQIVLEDIAKLLELFDKYPDKSVIILSDNKKYIETSVMLIDCERARWDIRDIVRRLDSDELNYQSLMFNMAHMKPEDYLVGADANWNSLDKYEEGQTKLLHYTHRSNQPWKQGLSKYTNLWMQELKHALKNNFVSEHLLKRHVEKKFLGNICLQVLDL